MATLERKVTIVEFKDGEISLFKDLNPQILTHMWLGDDIERAYCLLGSDIGRIVHNHFFPTELVTKVLRADGYKKSFTGD